MVNKIKTIIRTRTFKQSSLTSVSTLINGAFGALFYFFLARFLGSHDYGIFTVAVTTIALLASILDLGSDQGIVRFVPKYHQEPEKQEKIIKLALKIKLASGFLIFSLLLFFAGQISKSILNQPELRSVMPLIGIGVITQLLFSFSTSLSQALERFFLWSGLFVTTNFLRLMAIIGFYFLFILNVEVSIWIYILLPLMGFFFSLLFLDRRFLKIGQEGQVLKEMIGFNKWVTAFIVVAAISSRLDIYFTTRFLNLSAVGVYGLATQMTSILPQLTSAIGAVTSPKYASFRNQQRNLVYTQKAVFLTTGVALLSSLALIPLGFLVFKFSGSDFTNAMTPFLILLGAMVIFLATSPMRDSIIYYFEKPVFFFWDGLGHLLMIVLSSFWLIPQYGILGSALVVLFGQIFIALTVIGYFRFKSKK